MATEIHALFGKLVQHGRAEEIRLEAKAFNEALMNNAIHTEDATGRAELNVVDGAKFQRILHADSEVSFSFIPVDKVPEDSKHEARIIAAQHLTAGKSRKDGQVGRDTVNVYYRWKADGSLEIVRIKFFQRHASWSKAWWRDQMLVSLKTNSERSFCFWIILGRDAIGTDRAHSILVGCMGAPATDGTCGANYLDRLLWCSLWCFLDEHSKI